MSTSSPFARLDLTGQVLLITGGANGLGRATAMLAAARGASVMIGDLEAGPAEEVVESIRAEGGRAAYRTVDVSREEDIERLVSDTVHEFGGLTRAFNNAGFPSKGVPLKDVTLADWNHTIAVNLTGIFLGVKHEVRHMLVNGGGAIVNMSSIMGKVSVGNIPDYAAAKSGVLGITRVASTEYSGQGIRVNAVLPGAVITRILAPALEEPKMRAAMESGHPIGRFGTADEVAEVVLFLLSDAAGFITGSAYEIDGGYSAV